MRGRAMLIRSALVASAALVSFAVRAEESGKKTESSVAPASTARGTDAKASPPGPSDGVGPGRGSGSRRVDEKAAQTSAAPKDSTVEACQPESKAQAHHKGKPPARPNPTLPPGAERAAIDDDARRQIAGGPTVDDLAAGPADTELRELREVERVLFAKPLKGVQPGWSWDLPMRIDDGRPAVNASGLPVGAALPPQAALELGSEAAWVKNLTMPDLPVRLDAHVVKYLEFYRDDPRGRNIARVWAKKSGRLMPALKAAFARAGLPTDLIWLSLIESGHNPNIVSPAGAAGLWQFVPESARLYGLTVDRWVDERLDPERATAAAVRYLLDLRSRFGNWELAMAAYNMGHTGLLRAMRKFNTNDFWTLCRYEAGVPWETALYVPKILAVALVMNNKKAFGIEDVQPDAAISFDTVYVAPGVPLSEVAQAAQVPVEEVQALNSHYSVGQTPPGDIGKRWPVRVPPGRGVMTSQALAKATTLPKTSELERYMLRYGETLADVARARGTTEQQLRRLNRVTADERLPAGAVIVVPHGMAAAPQTDDDIVVVPARENRDPSRRQVFYRVLPGDSVSAIARAFRVSPSDLGSWNAIDASALLQPDMILQVFVPKDADLSSVRYVDPQQARILLAGSDEFFDYFESLNGRKRITITAKEGETLSGIGRRYGMTSGMMERINRYSRTKRLKAGDAVVVYARREAPVSSSSSSDIPAPLSPIEAPRPEALPDVAGAALLQPSNARSAARP